MPQGLTTRDLRRRNRARVLRSMVRDGETTRSELVAATRLSPATVTTILADLTAEGLVQDAGHRHSDVGRPTTTVAVRPEGAYIVGAAVNERGVTAEVFDLSLRQVSKATVDGAARSTAQADIAAALDLAITQAVAAAGAPASLYGVGLGMPGIVETNDTGAITIYAQTLGWTPTGLSGFYSHPDLPIFADNSAKTQAVAESWFGAARGVRDGLVALIGRGLGLGIISGGRVLRGVASSAGEWGHTKISIGGPACDCGARGCVEAYVGGVGIASRWSAAGGEPGNDIETVVEDLVAAAERGERSAVHVLDETVEILGLALANLVNLLNPERIVIGGRNGLQLIGARLEHMQAATQAQALARPGSQVELVPAHLGRDAVPLGAALLAVESLIESPAHVDEPALVRP